FFGFFFSSRRRHTRSYGDWSSDVCSSDLSGNILLAVLVNRMLPLVELLPMKLLMVLAPPSVVPPAELVVKRPPTITAGPVSVMEIGRASCREEGRDGGRGGAGKRKRQRGN